MKTIHSLEERLMLTMQHFFSLRHALAAFALASCLVGYGAHEQQADTLKSRRLGEVKVSGTGRQKAVSNSAPEQTLTARDMEQMGANSVSDAVRHMAGVTLHDYGGAGGLKTVSIRGLGAQFTGVNYDGVPLSDVQTGQIDLQRYTLNGVKQLDLLIGEGNDIFIAAREAVMPSLLTISTQGVSHRDHDLHLTAQAVMGAWGYTSPMLSAEKVWGKVAVSVLADYVYAENDYPFTIYNVRERIHKHRVHSTMNQGHVELNTRYAFSDSHTLNLKLYYYDNDRQLPGVVRYYTNDSQQQLRERTAFGQLQYRGVLSPKWQLKAAAKWNWANTDYRDKLYPEGRMDGNYWQREAYTSAALLYTPAEHWALDYSADYAFNNLNGSSWRTVVGRPYRHTLLQSATAKYRTSRLTVIGRLLLSLYLNGQRRTAASGRQDIQQNTAGDMRRLSPSVSVSYQLLPDRDLFVRASYKNIFRSPTFNESYYYHYGSTNLKPESTDQLNLGVTFTAGGQQHTVLSATLDGYYNHVRDMIVAVPQNMFVWTCVNIDRVRSYGMDATLRLSSLLADGHRLSFLGSYSYQRVENRNNPEASTYGYQVAYMPRHQGSLALSYENPWLNLSLHGTAVSSRWPNNDHYEGTLIPGYTDCGLTLWRAFRFGRHRLEGRFDLKNLFDKQYEIVARYPMPGRSYQVSISYQL